MATNVVIPGTPVILYAGPTLCGSGHICGEAVGGDLYYDWPIGLAGGNATTGLYLDVIISEGLLKEILCGQYVCGTGHLCGEVYSGERWYKWQTDLVSDQADLTATINPPLVVDGTGCLDLDGAGVNLKWDSLLVGDDTATVLQLDGGFGVLNPLLLAEVCTDLTLVAASCDDLSLDSALCEAA